MKDILKSKVIKYILGLSSVIFLIWYANCLPKTLFNDPESLVILDKDGQLMGAHVAQDEQWRFPETKDLNQKFISTLILTT